MENSKNFAYLLLKNEIIKFQVLFYDLRNDESSKILDAELELFKRQAGIILNHKREENVELKIIAKKSHDKSYEEFCVKPEYPSMDVPPLNELLSQNESHKLIRWELLQWCVGMGEEIYQIPTDLLVVIVTLNFMKKRGFLQVFEADLIFLSIKMAREKKYNKIFDKIPEIVNPQAFRLSFLFTKLHQPILTCFSVCGLKQIRVSSIFHCFDKF